MWECAKPLTSDLGADRVSVRGIRRSEYFVEDSDKLREELVRRAREDGRLKREREEREKDMNRKRKDVTQTKLKRLEVNALMRNVTSVSFSLTSAVRGRRGRRVFMIL